MRNFSQLSELLGGDDARIVRVLRAFRNEMRENVILPDDAMLMAGLRWPAGTDRSKPEQVTDLDPVA